MSIEDEVKEMKPIGMKIIPAKKSTKPRKPRVARYRVEGGIPTMDAPEDMTVVMLPKDLRHAVRKDPSNCGLAQACKRIIGGRGAEAQILRSFVYVKAPDSKGSWVWYRYRLNKITRRQIEEFDRTGRMKPGGYLFKAPTKSQTLEYRYKHQYERPRTYIPRGRRIRTGETITMDTTIRNGAGFVHHRLKK